MAPSAVNHISMVMCWSCDFFLNWRSYYTIVLYTFYHPQYSFLNPLSVAEKIKQKHYQYANVNNHFHLSNVKSKNENLTCSECAPPIKNHTRNSLIKDHAISNYEKTRWSVLTPKFQNLYFFLVDACRNDTLIL